MPIAYSSPTLIEHRVGKQICRAQHRLTGHGGWRELIERTESIPEELVGAVPSDWQSAETMTEQVRMLASGETTSTDLVGAAIERALASQPTLNAFKLIFEEEAMAAAAEADRMLAAGDRRPLLGVPVAVKDDMDIAGHPTAFGCPGDFAPKAEDGEMARRLKAAGAIVIGKTNTPEIGQWSVTAGPAFGVTRNPWNLEHTPGGSSGGAAAAVAAGVLPAAVGSDGAGSVRIPASWTNLVGIKPTRGRVSSWPDYEAFNGIAVIGPLARTVGDAALLLDAITGNHSQERHQLPAPERPFADSALTTPRSLRIALSFKIPFSGVPAKLDAAVRDRVERLAGVLENLGHVVVPTEPSYSFPGLNFLPRSTNGVAGWVDRVPDKSLLDHRTRELTRTGNLLGGPILKAARSYEGILRRRIGKTFREFDAILMPTTAVPPFEADAINGLGAWETDKLIVGGCPYAWTWNALGWPGVNVPAGFVGESLPIGAQLLGQAGSEPLLISLAAQLEQHERWYEQRPPIFS